MAVPVAGSTTSSLPASTPSTLRRLSVSSTAEGLPKNLERKRVTGEPGATRPAAVSTMIISDPGDSDILETL